jgi:opacity protein-like surface antigen
MFTSVRRHFAARFLAVALGAAVVGTAAEAATISASSDPGLLASQSNFFGGVGMDLGGFGLCDNSGALATNVGTFRRVSTTPGSGSSVCGDGGYSVQVKDQSVPNLFGRHNPPTGIGRWVDSNDIERVEWEIDTAALGLKDLTGIEFALIDAFDQRERPDLGASFFGLSVNGATWSIDSRDDNGEVYWITILFGQPVSNALITFNTRLNDGWGVANATIAPIPAPPAAFLTIGGFAILIALRRRRPA